MAKTRIAILGGGPAALATAFEITRSPDWSDRFEIDLYSIGWRLGGKCASGRNLANRGRNEEHGLHILGGFYHNCFELLRDLYDHWPRASPNALSFENAFRRHDHFTLMQQEPHGWRPVRVSLPRVEGRPGEDPPQVTVSETLRRIADWLGSALARLAAGLVPDTWLDAPEVPFTEILSADTREAFARASSVFKELAAGPLRKSSAAFFNDPDERAAAAAIDVQGHLQKPQLIDPPVKNADWLGVVELIVTIVRGFLADRLATLGYDSINDRDARAWLHEHGASDRALRCVLFTAGYHYAFGYTDGDPNRPDIAAGAGMRGLLRMVLAYQGSVFVHMNGGMGEVFVAPFYEVLKSRGVRFHLFHRVERLIADEAGALASVEMRVQAETKPGQAYDPILKYRPAPGEPARSSWSVNPDDAQLADPDAIRNVDLESWWGSAGVGRAKTLHAGAAGGFDLCVVALPVGMLRIVAADLARVEPAWHDMLAAAGTTPTIAAQLWRSDAAGTFGPLAHDGLLTGYALPHDTWADMSFLLELEQSAPVGPAPDSLAYLCGPVPMPPGAPGPDLPARELARAEHITQLWLDADATQIFPGLRTPAGVYDRAAELERVARINSDPVSLYVTTPAGSVDARMRCDDTGFQNLFVAGDWTRNNFDMGAIETAILSAKLCARAITGHSGFIYGESDFA